MKPYRLYCIIALIAVLAMFALPVSAQRGGPTMSVRAAYDGNFKYGEWLPIVAEIENPGSDVEAEVRVRVTGGSMSNVYVTPVSLPSGARKRVTVYVLPNNFTRVLEVRLVAGETLLASEKVQVRGQVNITYFAGLVAPERGALSLLPSAALPGQERAKFLVDLTLQDLPERKEALNSFDLLVINNVDTSRLTPQQAEALSGWVSNGGRLVIGGGTGAQSSLAGLPQELLPVKVTGTTEIDTDALSPLADFAQGEAVRVPGPFVLALSQPFEGGVVLVGSAEQPLVVERKVNHGYVDFVALDLTSAPFNGWVSTGGFWSKLLWNGAAFPDGMPTDVSFRQLVAGSFYGALSNIPTLDLPSVRGLSMMLIVYLLLVGPVNYFLLRRLDKLHMAWVTIPAITLVFTGIAFGIGFAMRGSDLVLNRVAVVEVQPDSPPVATVYMGLFSPARQQYEVEVDGSGLVSPMQMDYGPEMPGQPVIQETSFVQGQPLVVRGLSVNQWAMQSFMAETPWPELGKITGDLKIGNDSVVGIVKNETPYTLKDAVLAVNRRYQKLGDLAPGQEVKVDLGLAEMLKDWMGPTLSYRLYQDPNSPNFQGRIPRDVMQKIYILDSIVDGPPWSKIGANPSMSSVTVGLQGALLFGWLDTAPGKVTIRGHEFNQMTTSLVYASLPVGLPDSGRIGLAPGLLKGKTIALPKGGGPCGPGITTSVYMDGMEATMEFQIPKELLTTTITALKLSLQVDNPNATLRQFGIYDWQQETWGGVNLTTAGTVVVPNPSAYINSDGAVRINIMNDQGNPGCYYLDMGLEAERSRQGD